MREIFDSAIKIAKKIKKEEDIFREKALQITEETVEESWNLSSAGSKQMSLETALEAIRISENASAKLEDATRRFVDRQCVLANRRDMIERRALETECEPDTIKEILMEIRKGNITDADTAIRALPSNVTFSVMIDYSWGQEFLAGDYGTIDMAVSTAMGFAETAIRNQKTMGVGTGTVEARFDSSGGEIKVSFPNGESVIFKIVKNKR